MDRIGCIFRGKNGQSIWKNYVLLRLKFIRQRPERPTSYQPTVWCYGDTVYSPENAIYYDAGDFLRAKAPEADYQAWKQAYDKAVVKKTFSAKWFTNKKWDTFYGNNFTITPERQHGVTMYVLQSPFAGSHVVYNRDIKKLSWYYAVWQ